MLKKLLLPFVILFLVSLVRGTQAQDAPTVYAVLFYSPTCPHCHTVIEDHLPPMVSEFGDAMQVLFVNVAHPEGANLYRAACAAYEIPTSECGGVPALFVGDEMLRGSLEIPQRFPTIVRDGLAEGGIPAPDIPGLRELYASTTGEELPVSNAAPAAPNWQDNLRADPLANALALVVLVVLAVSGAIVVITESSALRTQRPSKWLHSRAGRGLAAVVALLTLMVAATLAVGGGFTLPALLALGVTVVLIVTVGELIFKEDPSQLPTWLFPLLLVCGLVVAGYLLYIESGSNEAVCGAVGNCNIVQQSDYTYLFGVLPIGMFGVIGYAVILVAWWLSRQSGTTLAVWGQNALFVLTLFGVVFSIYLTFLEPFVIGATCAWCLTSALLMALLLWLQALAWRPMSLQPKQAKGAKI